MGNLFTEIMRRLFGLLDGIVIFLIETLYSLLMEIADTNVLGELVYHYLGRIYTFLGVFMLFKLSLAVINYIINPDSLTEKGKGFGKLIGNVVISLVLLVITPNLFTAAFQLQKDILNSNAIFQIVTGRQLGLTDANTNNKIMGKKIAYGVYSSFIYPDSGNDDLPTNAGSDSNAFAPLTESGKCDNVAKPRCLIDSETILKKDNGKFANNYWYLISTICGGAVVYMLLIFCLDTSIRAIKLGILQIIAPIPIMSMMDPSTGTKKIATWGKECGKTFAELFIRLAGLFFAIDIINNILTNTNGVMTKYSSGAGQQLLFVRLFIIIGCLMFAKDLPKFLGDILGIKLDGGGGFNLKKRLNSVPGLGVAKTAGKALGAGAIGFAGGAAANMLAGAKNNFSWDKSKGVLRNLGSNAWHGVGGTAASMVGGGLSGSARGTFSKEKNMIKAGRAGIKGSVDARNLRDERQLAGDSGPKGVVRRAGVGVSNWAGIESGATKFDKQIAAYDKFLKQQGDLDKYVEGEIAKGKGSRRTNFSWTDVNGRKIRSSGNVNVLKQEIEVLKATPGASAESIQNAEYKYKAALKQAKQDYVDAGISGTGDAAVKNFVSEMNYTISSNSSDDEFRNMGQITTGSKWDESKKTITKAKSNITVTDKYRKAQINKKNDAK